MTKSRDAAHFEQLYRDNPDPWSFETSTYEQEKYESTLSALGGRRFCSGLEVGCSIGKLTQLLALHCDHLLGIDIVKAPLLTATARCADQPWVQFQQLRVPLEWPQNRFDLIVLSEVLYYHSPTDIDHCASRVQETLQPGGIALLVNWLGETDDPTTGNNAAIRFIRASASLLQVVRQKRNEWYRLDVLQAI